MTPKATDSTLESMVQVIFKSWFLNFDPVYTKIEDLDYLLSPDVMEEFGLKV